MLRCWAENSVRKLIPAEGFGLFLRRGGGREEEIEACGLRACAVRTEGTVGFSPPAQKEKNMSEKGGFESEGTKKGAGCSLSSCGCLCRREEDEILEILGIY